jgi:hypothetical protein
MVIFTCSTQQGTKLFLDHTKTKAVVV